jgi:hypothetical protein
MGNLEDFVEYKRWNQNLRYNNPLLQDSKHLVEVNY